jgi:glycosyltransferase involved in cell wall biosynthesis
LIHEVTTSKETALKIAMFGVKGIPVPAGAENVAEQIGSRLVRRGHEVTVYVRAHYTPRIIKEYKGIRLVHLPSIASKNLDAFTHSSLASVACTLGNPDVVHIHGMGNSVFSFIPRLFGIPTVVQSHGLDWQRAKWGLLARNYLKLTDYTIIHFPSATTVVSQKLQRYYETNYGKSVVYIPNGVEPCQKLPSKEILKYGLHGNDYIFFAARLVPEKGCDYLIQAYQSLRRPDKKLVIAGDGVLGDDYARRLRMNASENILFLGFVQGSTLSELLSNAYMYVLPSEIEGLSTGLLEAMSYGNCVLVSDIEENLEAIGEAGLSFRSRSWADLAAKMKTLLEDETLVQGFRDRAKNAVRMKYDWERVTDQYEALYLALLEGEAPHLGQPVPKTRR